MGIFERKPLVPVMIYLFFCVGSQILIVQSFEGKITT